MKDKKSVLDGMVAKENSFIVIRCDGRGFSKLKDKHSKTKSYDKDFHEKLTKISGSAIEELFRCGMAYVISDEISFILPRNFNLFNRRIEKLISLSSGYVSGEGSLEFYEICVDPISFDAKLFTFDTIEEVVEYLDERKNFGFRNFVYTLLRDSEMKNGKSSTQFAKELNGKSTSYQIDILLKKNIDIYKMQYWKREGELLHLEPFTRKVKTGAFGARVEEEVQRRRLVNVKPLKFCPEDKAIIEKMINSEYGGQDERT